MEKIILSPHKPGARALLRQREFRLWHKNQWVPNYYWVYMCEATGKDVFTAEVKAANKSIADNFLEERSK